MKHAAEVPVEIVNALIAESIKTKTMKDIHSRSTGWKPLSGKLLAELEEARARLPYMRPVAQDPNRIGPVDPARKLPHKPIASPTTPESAYKPRQHAPGSIGYNMQRRAGELPNRQMRRLERPSALKRAGQAVAGGFRSAVGGIKRALRPHKPEGTYAPAFKLPGALKPGDSLTGRKDQETGPAGRVARMRGGIESLKDPKLRPYKQKSTLSQSNLPFGKKGLEQNPPNPDAGMGSKLGRALLGRRRNPNMPASDTNPRRHSWAEPEAPIQKKRQKQQEFAF